MCVCSFKCVSADRTTHLEFEAGYRMCNESCAWNEIVATMTASDCRARECCLLKQIQVASNTAVSRRLLLLPGLHPHPLSRWDPLLQDYFDQPKAQLYYSKITSNLCAREEIC